MIDRCQSHLIHSWPCLCPCPRNRGGCRWPSSPWTQVESLSRYGSQCHCYKLMFTVTVLELPGSYVLRVSEEVCSDDSVIVV